MKERTFLDEELLSWGISAVCLLVNDRVAVLFAGVVVVELELYNET